VIPCFILARLGSERLPKKHMMRLGSTNVIDHAVRRCMHFGFKPFLCVPEGEYDAFNSASVALDIFEGDPANVETRLMECAHHYDIKIFHALDGDDPFFDHFAVLESFNTAKVHRLWRVTPSYHSRSGSGRMGTTYNLDAPAGGDRNLLDQEQYPWPQRLTLDYPEDYFLLAAVNRAVGGYMADRKQVDELFVKNPQLHLVNWHLTEQWKERQLHESRFRIREKVCLETGD
jgi:spore coat polysaccharide biosynthesis protein SpsF (cytidylyltransferase family)